MASPSHDNSAAAKRDAGAGDGYGQRRPVVAPIDTSRPSDARRGAGVAGDRRAVSSDSSPHLTLSNLTPTSSARFSHHQLALRAASRGSAHEYDFLDEEGEGEDGDGDDDDDGHHHGDGDDDGVDEEEEEDERLLAETDTRSRGALGLSLGSRSHSRPRSRSRSRSRRRPTSPPSSRRRRGAGGTTFCSSLWASLLAPRTTIVHSLRHADDAFRDPTTGRRVYKPRWLDAWIPILIWAGVSLTSTAVIVLFHDQVFRGESSPSVVVRRLAFGAPTWMCGRLNPLLPHRTGLDRLSAELRSYGFGGRGIMWSLIFITTFPPLPLYSTLIVLSGFSFGWLQGFLVSYTAALTGAIVVFLLSRFIFREKMNSLLAASDGLRKVVRAIEKKPSLLFLIRLAPYPYNLMNTLLASSRTLSLKVYTLCTALALPKLLVHCGLGATIKNFAAYHANKEPAGSSNTTTTPVDGQPVAASSTRNHTMQVVKEVATIIGVALCVAIFLYLLYVARKAVDELDDEQLHPQSQPQPYSPDAMHHHPRTEEGRAGYARLGERADDDGETIAVKRGGDGGRGSVTSDRAGRDGNGGSMGHGRSGSTGWAGGRVTSSSSSSSSPPSSYPPFAPEDGEEIKKEG